MKPEINKLDYSSYRIPYIDEFIKGFEYEYVDWSLVYDTKIPTEGLCKCIVGNTILQARILNVNSSNKTVHVKFLEKGYNDYYMKVMGYDFNLATNEDKKFPIELLYNYKGYEEPYKFFKSTQKHWRKGIWKSAWGYGRKDDLLKALKKGDIITKGQIISKHNPSPNKGNNIYPWVVIHYPENIGTNKIVTKSLILKSLGNTDIIQKEEVKIKYMSTKELRNKLLKGYILCFMYNGLQVEIKPPLITSDKSYDFSKSIFINNMLLPSLSINSKEYIKWMETDTSSFKEKIYELINSNQNIIFEEDENNVLLRHCYNIRSNSDNEIYYYTVSYILNKEPTKIQIEVLTEYNKDRAKASVIHKIECYPDEIKNVHEHGT